jgi:hypothetical protein
MHEVVRETIFFGFLSTLFIQDKSRRLEIAIEVDYNDHQYALSFASLMIHKIILLPA